jgi:hypothetical protein
MRAALERHLTVVTFLEFAACCLVSVFHCLQDLVFCLLIVCVCSSLSFRTASDSDVPQGEQNKCGGFR